VGLNEGGRNRDVRSRKENLRSILTHLGMLRGLLVLTMEYCLVLKLHWWQTECQDMGYSMAAPELLRFVRSTVVSLKPD
jgi:hypothetical protein